MITRVYLENWKSHHETELSFSSGVNVLIGEMGAGKSSVLEAICFGLYGTTPALRSRTVTLDELIRRIPSPANDAVIEVDFRQDGTTYTVRREIERDKGTTTSELREDGELLVAPQAGEVTDAVTDLLGINYGLFSRAIYSEQNQLDYFLELRAGEREEKIDELLALDRFETARSTLVSLVNRLADRKDDRQEELQQLEDSLEEAEIEDVEEKVADAEDTIDDLEEEYGRVTDNLADAREELEELEEQRDQVQEMEERRTALETRIETLEERITEKNELAGGFAGLDSDKLAAEQEDLEDELAALEEQEQEITDLANRIETLEDRREELEQERADLVEKQEAAAGLDDVEQQLEEAQDALAEKQSERERLRAQLDDVEETLSQLSGAADTCPTCGQDLSEEHRVEVLQESRAEKEDIEDRLDDVGDDIAELEDAVEELQDERDQLVELKGASDRLDEVDAQLEEVEQQLEETEAELETARDAYDEDREEELDTALDQTDAAETAAELQAEKAEREEELAELAEQIEETGFDEEHLEEVQERVNELATREEVIDSKIEDTETVLAERRKRLSELQDMQDRIDEYRDAVTSYRRKIDVMEDLQHAVETTQVQLRERFVGSVNDVMEDVWDRVYPYQAYQRIRLNAAEGYALKLMDEEGNWIAVEGEVSGGERHAAALTLRIALSIVLSPSWQVLMLDEPTHNLDATAIDDLADTLRTRVADIVDQLFLITHEERLETAATGDLYTLSTKGAKNRLTAVQHATGE
ncbi:MAG: SMC family ATPase [Candidatus Nanohaloarchaea archaeon]|nr:SMC family ATPase [Candidatus Nanohaloarchaea archaeon]